MTFFKEDKSVVINLETQTLQATNSLVSERHSGLSLSNFTCGACLCLVPLLGAAGLYMGFGITFLLLDHIKQASEIIQDLSLILPSSIGMVVGMGLAFYIWGKSVDWAVAWELNVARHPDPSFKAACQEFFTYVSHQLSGCTTNIVRTLHCEEDLEHNEFAIH